MFSYHGDLIAIPICNVVVMPAALVTLVAMPFGLEAAPLAVMGWGIEAMTRCAQWVAALPGAVGRVPAVPTLAFVLVVAGGLWCALWSRRWRWLGIVPIALGLILAPTGRRPDVLVGRGGSTVAVRADDGTLSALAGRGSNFELARWLEYDGDARPPAEAAKARAFRCDAMGCTARVKGLLVTVSGAAAALRDDCAMADLLVLRQAKPRGCSPRGAAIDGDALAAAGAHAAYVDGGRLTIETVAEKRGDRPWAPRAHRGAAHHPLAADPLEEDTPVRGRR